MLLYSYTSCPEQTGGYSTNEDFTKAYPAANRGIKQLLSAIQLKRDRRRVSKNGTPAERDDKQRRDSVEASSSDEESESDSQ